MAKNTSTGASGQEKFKRADFVALVEAIVDAKPYFHAGHAWTAMRQDTLADAAGVSVMTIQRWIRTSPFVTKRKEVDDRPLCLIRIGEPDAPPSPHDPEVLAKAMSKAWNKRLRVIRTKEVSDLKAIGEHAEAAKLEAEPQRRTAKAEYGCMIGFATKWPPEHALAIFENAVTNWSAYMAGVKVVQATDPNAKPRFMRYPSPRYMKDYPDVALELWIGHMQHHHPIEAKALGLWKLYPQQVA